MKEHLVAGVNLDVKKAANSQALAATALYWAAEQGHIDVVRILLDYGAQVDAPTAPPTFTPLISAARNGYSSIVSILLGFGAKIDAEDDDGRTALIHAAANGHLEVVQALLAGGADVMIMEYVEGVGVTAEDWARTNGHIEIAELVKLNTPPLIIGNMVEAWLNNYSSLQIATTYRAQEMTYILVSQGLRETLGYGVEITRISEGPDEVEVYVKFTYPEEGKIYPVEPNTPYVLTTIPYTKTVVFMTEDPNDYVPTLVGVPDTFTLYSEGYWLEYVPDTEDSPVPGNIIIGVTLEGLNNRPEGKVVVEGIARVFEAYVEYDILDKNGKAFNHGGVLAASAGPNWGYFRIELDLPAGGFSAIRVYSTSAKDGTIMDLVIIRP